MVDENEGKSRRIVVLFYLLLTAGGLCLYIIWGMMYNSWNIFTIDNMAIYAFFFTMVGAGVTGFLLYGRNLEIL